MNQRTLFATLALAALLAACELPSSGIFYSLENESAISNASNGLAKDVKSSQAITVSNYCLVLVGTGIYRHELPAVNANGVLPGFSGAWTRLSAPDTSHSSCVGLAKQGSVVYALFASNSNSLDGVNTSASTLPQLYSASDVSGTPSWTQISLPASPAGLVPLAFFNNASGSLLLESAVYGGTSPSYQLHTLSGATVSAPLSGFGGNYRPVKGVAGPDSQTMIITGDKVYTSDLSVGSPSLTLRANPSSPGSALPSFSAVLHLSGNEYLLASASGWLARSLDAGASWTSSAAILQNAAKKTIQFSALVYLNPLADNSGGSAISQQILAGSSGQGIFQLDLANLSVLPRPANPEGDLLWGGDYSSAALSLNSVQGFYPIAGNRVFVASNNVGIWSLIFDSNSTKTTPAKSGLFFTWE